MKAADFRKRMLAGEILAGTFVKTPALELIEVLALSGLDFVCLDGEHSPFDRGRMDACLAVARALDFPTLVRVGSGTAENILQALDSGAVGIVVPHVIDAGKARDIARWARFGLYGRGYAGSTRWAGYGQRPMSEVLELSKQETVVIAQIEEPEAVDASEEIAAVEGIDGLFVGPADLTVAFGAGKDAAAKLEEAFASVGRAAKAAGKACMSLVTDIETAARWRSRGLSMFFYNSEQGLMLSAAKEAAGRLHGLD